MVWATRSLKERDRKHRYIRLQITSADPAPYIADHNVQLHGEITGRCATIDSGRQDLLYCVHENFIADALSTYRYTKSC